MSRDDLVLSWGRFMLLDEQPGVLIDWAVRRLVADTEGTGDAMALLASMSSTAASVDVIEAFQAALEAIGAALPDEDETRPVVVRFLIDEHDAGVMTLRELVSRLDALNIPAWHHIDMDFECAEAGYGSLVGAQLSAQQALTDLRHELAVRASLRDPRPRVAHAEVVARVKARFQ